MAKLSLLGTAVVVKTTMPHWVTRKSLIIARYHNPESADQLKARIALMRAASAAYGSRGFVGRLPVVAAAVQSRTAGQRYGNADARRAAARESRHNAVPGKIRQYQGLIRSKESSGGGGIPSAGASEFAAIPEY